MTEHIRVTGAVQGIGYRPFAVKEAVKLHIGGEVRNAGGVVEITATGKKAALDEFARRLRDEAPEGAAVLSVVRTPLPAQTFDGFRVVQSSEDAGTAKELPVFPPDLAMCTVCDREMNDPADRRYRYPLISCAGCGPRFSILKALPYDRENTTMEDFAMCPQCAADYAAGRRHYAQTVSCPDCGPQMILSLQDGAASTEKRVRYTGEKAMKQACALLRAGGILAVKGIGGFQFFCSPFNGPAAERLRRIKGREKKPFAVMCADMAEIRRICPVSDEEEALLRSPARPIVLVGDGRVFPFSPAVCGDSRYAGLFLPSFGVQERLVKECGPLIATSANLSGQPIPTDEKTYFAGMDGRNAADSENSLPHPDGVLYHGRRILRPLDDSVAFVSAGRTAMVRRSRGYVPTPVFLQEKTAENSGSVIFAAGGDLKAAFALRRGGRVILSQYFGDLEEYANLQNYRKEEQNYETIFGAEPGVIVCDLHPRYFSSAFAADLAAERGLPLVKVQHHHAHIASVMAEHGLDSCIGIAFDGTGYGNDGSLWGGEFLLCRGASAERRASLSPVLLAGGDVASVQAKQTADCYRYAAGDRNIPPLLAGLLEHRISTAESTSAGRLFDAAASLLGLRDENGYEGECAIALENAAAKAAEIKTPKEVLREMRVRGWFREEDLVKKGSGRILLDQTAFVRAMTEAQAHGADSREVALAFHAALASCSVSVCEAIAEESGERRVALSGGVFANRILRDEMREGLTERGLDVYFNEQVPMNDGGIALGQALIAGRASVPADAAKAE